MGRKTKYDYYKWKDGQPHTLTNPEDFQCSVQAMRTRLHEHGKSCGYDVRTIIKDATTIVVVFLK